MPALKPDNVLQWLLGEWTLSREAAGHATVHGRATFLLIEGNAAAYHESVSVQLVNRTQPLHAEQRYEYRQTEQGLAVYFAPPSPEAGKLFHLLSFSVHGEDLRAQARHLCKADFYVSEYVIPTNEAADGFNVRHDVVGPRKEYSLLTTYIRR